MNILTYTADKESRNVHLTCSDGRDQLIDNWNDLAAFLLVKCDMALVHNIDHFVTTIADILPKKLKDDLLSGGRYYHPDRTKLYYQPGRMFGINYVNDISFYGLSRYAEDSKYTANELMALANAVFEAYSVFGIVPKSLTSPVAVYGEMLASLEFPRACDLPDSAHGMIEAATEVMSNEWRELYQIGHWNAGEVWDYDISSAYPSIIARLPDLSQANF